MRVLLGLVLAVGVLTAAAPARADVTWLCHPAATSDPCDGDLRTTDLATNEVRTPHVPANPKVDCFYVYPTTSNEPGPNASLLAGPEIRAIATYQAQMFRRVCRVFAPVYRQITVPARTLNLSVDAAAPLAYADVRDAFRQYLAADNAGRGFVLIGHSQGATMLRALIRGEIDGVPRIRKRLVAAILPGANVLVRKGLDRGGDFEHVPVCRERGDTACVAAWSTFDYTPPDDALFGRPRAGGTAGALGLPSGDEYEVVCTNPALLGDARRNRLWTLVPSQLVFPGIIGLLLLQTYGGLSPLAPTPWVRPADRYSADCSSEGGANVLRITPVGDARRLRPAPNDTWGQHLVDLNLPLGNLVAAVRAAIRGYRAISLRVRRRGGTVVVTVRTAPNSRVRVTQRRGRRVTARKTVRVGPSGRAKVRLPAKRLRSYDYRARRLRRLP